jgi:hypothetical protein
MPDGTSLSADWVEVGNYASVFHVYANGLLKGEGAVVRDGVDPVSIPLALPICTLPAFTCGTDPILVMPGAVEGPIAPGAYGVVRVMGDATLRLSEGVYTMCDLRIGRSGNLIAEGNVVLQIVGNLSVGTDSYFGPDFGAPPIVAYVGGRSVKISHGANAVARIVAPFARTAVGRDGVVLGCVCSDRFKSDKGITLKCPAS